MRKIFLYAVSLFFVVNIFSCSKEEDDKVTVILRDSLRFAFNATTNGMPLEFMKEFDDPIGRKMRVELFKTYISNIYLISSTGKTKVVDVALVTFEDNGEPDIGNLKQEFTIRVPIGDYTGLMLGIGLNPDQNNADPSSFDDEHPMSIQQGTYWTTWDKYRFLLIEGRADGDGDGALTDLYGYHTGFDLSYREKTFNKSFKVEEGKLNTLNFTIEVNDLFFGNDTLDIITEPTWHGDTIQVSRAIRLSNNAIDALKLE